MSDTYSEGRGRLRVRKTNGESKLDPCDDGVCAGRFAPTRETSGWIGEPQMRNAMKEKCIYITYQVFVKSYIIVAEIIGFGSKEL